MAPIADGAPPPLLRTRRGLMFTALPAIAVLAVLAAVLAIEHRDSSVSDRKDELRRLAVAASVSARRFLDDQFAILATAAASPTLRAGRPAEVRSYLIDIERMGRFTSGLSLVGQDAKAHVTTLLPVPSKPIDVSDRDYIRAALDGTPTVSDVLLGKVKGRPITAFAFPVPGRGAIAGSLLLDKFDDALRRLVFSPGANETIIDGADHVIVGPNGVRGLQPAPAAFPLRALRHAESGVIDHVDARVAGFAAVPDTDWVVVVDRERSAVLGPLDRALWAEIGALAVLALIGVLLTLATARRLDRLDRQRDEALSEQRAIALQLQTSLLPDLRVPEQVEAYAGYVPAQGAMSVGGDWYDLVDMGGGRVALSVGDVAGHGLAAAATMGKLRSATRAEALHGSSPVQALSGLDRFASYLDGRPLATVVFAVLDTNTGVLRYALAGHPPPLLIRADGTTELLEGGRSPLLGVTPVTPRAEAEVVMRAGDTLVAYTDGLVEHPNESIDDGIADLAVRAPELARDAPNLADALLASVAEPRRDDAAVLVVKLQP
jgi:serine phosphatase RsbU (regulator of sigma subunit)